VVDGVLQHATERLPASSYTRRPLVTEPRRQV